MRRPHFLAFRALQAAADLECVAVSDPLTKEFESAEPAEKAVVVATAAEDGDALCSQAVSMLMTAYGAEAGNVALKFMYALHTTRG